MARNDEKHTFAVWGAPQSGKSTVAVNMATVLAESGYMTCLISAADHGELQAFFQAAIPRNKGLYAAISNGKNVREALTEARPNLCLLELDTGGDAYEVANIATDQVERIIQELNDQFSYVIIDCTNYKESVFTGIGLVEADKVVVCIPHRVSAATWHIANEQMLDAVGSKTVYVDADINEGGTDMEQLLESVGLPECPIKIKRVRSAFYCENTGNVIVLQGGKEEKKYKKAILDLIQMLIALEDEDSTTAKANKEKKEGKQSRKDRKEKRSGGLFGRKKDKDAAKQAQGTEDDEAEREDEDIPQATEDEDVPARRQRRREREAAQDYGDDLSPRHSSVEDDEESEDEESLRPRRRRRSVVNDETEESEGEDERLFAPYKREREPREIEGRQKHMSARQLRRAEEAAIREAQEDTRRRYYEEEE